MLKMRMLEVTVVRSSTSVENISDDGMKRRPSVCTNGREVIDGESGEVS